MALINCPECGKQISDRAKTCIFCGYPIQEYMEEQKQKEQEKKKDIPIRDDICPQCGNEISPVFRVCNKCGYSQYGNAERDYEATHRYNVNQKIEKHDETERDYSKLNSYLSQDSNKKVKKKKKHSFLKLIAVLIIVYFVLSAFNKEVDDYVDKEEKRQTEYETGIDTEETTELSTTEAETDISDLSFVDEMKTLTSESIANGAYDVLTNKLGFSDVEFEQKLGDTSNYEITANGVSMVITAMDDYYRVFIPDTSYVLYEDGNVLMNAQDIADRTINWDDRISYYLMAQEFIKDCLNNPSSAKFPSINTSSDIGMSKNGDMITVQGYVDCKNAFNATVRSNYTVQFNVIDMDSYSYEPLYVNIDGDEAGEYTDPS